MNELLSWTDTLESRRAALEARLYAARIADMEITCLSYLDASHWQFRDTVATARRILVLYALALAAYKPAKKIPILTWLQHEQLKPLLTPEEKAFLQSSDSDAATLAKYSWNLEAAYILAWSLELVPDAPDAATEAPIAALLACIPHLGEDTTDFVHNCHYRDADTLVEECVFTDLAVTHLRRLHQQGARTVERLHPMALFARKRALKWLVETRPQGA